MAESRNFSVRFFVAGALTLCIVLAAAPTMARDCGPGSTAGDGCIVQPGDNPGINSDGDSGGDADRDRGRKQSSLVLAPVAG